MKSVFSTLLLVCIYTCTFSQRQILYDLDSYKRVDFDRRALNVFPSGGFSAFDQVNVAGQSAVLDLSVQGRLNYNADVNNQAQQKTTGYEVDLEISDRSRLQTTSDLTVRRYGGNSFFLIGYDLIGDYFHASQDGSQNFNSRLGGNIDLGIGKGRIEIVNTAWQAVGLFQTLENDGLLLKIPTEDAISLLADIIGAETERRYFDFRLRSIRILEVISEFLVENNFIEQTSIRATILIQDALRYDFNEVRRSGSRIDAIFSPKLVGRVFNTNSNLGSVRIGMLQTGFDGELSYTSVSNFDVHWSRSIYYGGKMELDLFYDNDENFEQTSSLKPYLFYDFGYNYFPNLRNNFNLNIYSDISTIATKRSSGSTNWSRVRLRHLISSSYNRYLSPRTLVSIFLSAEYNDLEFRAGDYQPSISGSVSFGITHSIF